MPVFICFVLCFVVFFVFFLLFVGFSAEFLVISERVAQGSMKQLRECVILEFKMINRRYRIKFNNATLLHIICQEGYYEMLEFIVEDKNHSSLDETKLELAPRNDRNRTPLHLCFTPPTLTYLGQKYVYSK